MFDFPAVGTFRAYFPALSFVSVCIYLALFLRVCACIGNLFVLILC